MSRTTTTATSNSEIQLEQASSVRQILRAYDIHQTGAHGEQRSGWSTDVPYAPSQRVDWNSDRRRIPPYRETDRSHRLADRPAGRTGGESAFVIMMFSGAYVVSVRDYLCHNRSP